MNLWGEIGIMSFFFRILILALTFLIILNFISCSFSECCFMTSNSWALGSSYLLTCDLSASWALLIYYWELMLCMPSCSSCYGTGSSRSFFTCFLAYHEKHWTNFYINFSGRASWFWLLLLVLHSQGRHKPRVSLSQLNFSLPLRIQVETDKLCWDGWHFF